MSIYKAIAILYSLFLSLSSSVKSEFFTSVVGLQRLQQTVAEIVAILENCVKYEEHRLERLKWLRKEYEKLNDAAGKDYENFQLNPVNAYVLVKRLTVDWNTTIRLMEDSFVKKIIENTTFQQLKFPDSEDLNGAATALVRLQETYLLNVTTLAKGRIGGSVFSLELSAGDCFELGRQAFENKDYHHTVLWMQEALRKVEIEKIKTANKTVILEYISSSSYLVENMKDVVKMIEELIEARTSVL